MAAKHVALLALLTAVGSSCVVYAQPPDTPPPMQDQYAPPDQYGQPADQPAPLPEDRYNPAPAQAPYDQANYQPDQNYPPDQNYSPDQNYQPDQYAPAPAPYAGGGPMPARGEVDVNFFYTNLSPYGHWVQRGSYGWVWLPFGVRAGWRPYTLGHWVMTDYGWTWVSDEPFGWATYHYGRWRYDDEFGWAWVPGYEWGPAWVAWRNGGGYIGWAPLPPEVRFRAGFGLDLGGVNLEVVLAPTHYCFVQERSFLQARVATYIAPSVRNVTIINNTTNITNYRVENNRVINQGLSVQRVEQATGRRVQQFQVAAVTSGTARNPQVRGNQLAVFRPAVVQRAQTPAPPPSTRVTAPAALARQHQQEIQNLQQSQTADRARLQQLHQTERQKYQSGGAGQPGQANPPTQPSERQRQRQPSDQAQAQQPAQQEAAGRRAQQQAQDQQRQGRTQEQPQPAQRRAPVNDQALQQQHQAEVQAQQAQHQREQQQLAARHQAEQTQARQQPPPRNNSGGNNRQGGQRQQRQDEKHPSNPPPPPLRLR